MKPFALAPYFHPTTVCVVDDNESFLESLCFEMPASWAWRSFVDPFEARDFLTEECALEPLADRCLSAAPAGGSEATLHLDLSLIEQEINHVERFRRVSVLIVDYAMPALNGLDLCAGLNDPYLRTIMLTGVADEKLAVEAFNAGLLHRFVPKQGTDAIATTIAYMEELNQAYFAQHTARLRNALSVSPPQFLMDPAIRAWVAQLMQQERFIEYYLVDEPPGFLLLRSDGSMQRLLILDAAALHAQLDFAIRHNAPEAVRTSIGERRAACLFSGDQPGNYFGEERFGWAESMVTLEHVRGETDWSLGVSIDPPADIDFDPSRTSYDAYRAGLVR